MRLFDREQESTAPPETTYRFPMTRKRVRGFYAPTLTHIPVADKPPRLGGVIKQIPTAKFCQQHDILWSDATVVSPEYIQNIWRIGAIPPFQDRVEFRIFNPVSVVLAHMERMGTGAFLSPEAEPIKRGDIVYATYGGLLIEDEIQHLLSQQNPYLFDLNRAENHPQPPQARGIIADKHRGMAGFFQHAPAECEIEKAVHVDENIKPYVFHANLLQHVDYYLGMPIVSFYALRRIKPEDPLAYTYGSNYWKGKSCYVINAEGAPIGIMENNRITKLNTSSESLLITRVPSNGDIKEPILEEYSNTNINYAQTFLKNIALYLQQQMMLHHCLSSRYQCAAILYAQIQVSENVHAAWTGIDLMYKSISNQFKKDTSMYDFLNKLHTFIEIYRSRREKSNDDTNNAPIDLTDLPFDPKIEERNYMICFNEKVKQTILTTVRSENPDIKASITLILEDIDRCEKSDEVFHHISKLCTDWKKKKHSPFSTLIKPLIKLMKQYNAAQKVARYNREYVVKLLEEYKIHSQIQLDSPSPNTSEKTQLSI